jgi:hypothetical protein
MQDADLAARTQAVNPISGVGSISAPSSHPLTSRTRTTGDWRRGYRTAIVRKDASPTYRLAWQGLRRERVPCTRSQLDGSQA